MAKIVDPDLLIRNTEIIFDTTAKTIQLLVAGNLDDNSPGRSSGVTLQAVYSKCKELWKSETDLGRLKFPFDAITEAKMDLINTWDWADQQTRDLIRDGGWCLRGTTGLSEEEYMCIVSLGDFDAVTDQAYYQQIAGFNQAVANLDKTGETNEPIKIYGDATHGNFNYRSFFKIYLREQAKLYDKSNLVVDQDIPVLDYTVYKLPLSNTGDIKVVASDITIDTTEPYVGTSDLSITDGSVTAGSPTFSSVTGGFVAGDVGKLITIATGDNAGRYEIITFIDTNNVDVDRNFTTTETAIVADRRPKGMTVDYLIGQLFATWAVSTAYALTDVVLDSINGRWYRCILAHTSPPADAAWLASTAYALGDYVVPTTENGYRYECTTAGTSGTTEPVWPTTIGATVTDGSVVWTCRAKNPSTDTTNWESYPGEEQIGANWYAFNRVVDGNGGTLEQVYEFVQRQLRKTTADTININDNVAGDNYGTVNGNIAVVLANFLGDTLQSNPGVVVRNFDVNDINRIQMFDITVDGGGLDSEDVPLTTTQREFPFVSAGTIVFNQELIDDPDAEFCMYFTTNPAGNFDTVDAVIVQDDDGLDIKAETITGDVSFTFDYDGNTQGGRTPGTDAAITIVAIGLNGAQYVLAEFTITRATGLSFPVNAAKERNYSNP